MNEDGAPKLMQNVVKNEWKQKSNAKYTVKKMQNVVQNEWKLYSNAKCSPKIVQNVVRIWSKV